MHPQAFLPTFDVGKKSNYVHVYITQNADKVLVASSSQNCTWPKKEEINKESVKYERLVSPIEDNRRVTVVHQWVSVCEGRARGLNRTPGAYLYGSFFIIQIP